MNNRPTKPPPAATPVRPPPRPTPPVSTPAAALPELPDIPELPDDIPDEYRPLMKGMRSRPSARATPARGIQLPSLNNPNAAAAAAHTSAERPAFGPAKPGQASPSGRAPASNGIAPKTSPSGRSPAIQPGVKPNGTGFIKPPSGTGFIKPPSGTGFVKPPSGGGFGKPSASGTGIFKPPSGVAPFAKPSSGISGYPPQPVILSNDSSKSSSSVSPRATPARGIPTLTPAPMPVTGSTRLPMAAVGNAHVGNRSSQKMGWVCHRCHCKVDPESIVRNEAVMIDGLPLCGRCVREGKSDKLRKTAQVLGAVALCMGTIACLVVFAKSSLGSGKDRQALEQAQVVQSVAESGNIAEAEQRVAALLSTVESGACKDADVISAAYKAEDTLKNRIKSLYGELSPKEHELLTYLAASYPGPDAKHERVRALHVDDENNFATLTMVFDPAQAQDNYKTEVRAFTVALLQRFPKISSVTLTLQYFTGDTLADAGNFSLDRATAAATVKTGAPINPGNGANANPSEQNTAPVRMVNPIAPLPPALNAPPVVRNTPPNQSQNNPNPPAVERKIVPAIPANQPGIFDPSKAPAMPAH